MLKTKPEKYFLLYMYTTVYKTNKWPKLDQSIIPNSSITNIYSFYYCFSDLSQIEIFLPLYSGSNSWSWRSNYMLWEPSSGAAECPTSQRSCSRSCDLPWRQDCTSPGTQSRWSACCDTGASEAKHTHQDSSKPPEVTVSIKLHDCISLVAQ